MPTASGSEWAHHSHVASRIELREVVVKSLALRLTEWAARGLHHYRARATTGLRTESFFKKTEPLGAFYVGQVELGGKCIAEGADEACQNRNNDYPHGNHDATMKMRECAKSFQHEGSVRLDVVGGSTSVISGGCCESHSQF